MNTSTLPRISHHFFLRSPRERHMHKIKWQIGNEASLYCNQEGFRLILQFQVLQLVGLDTWLGSHSTQKPKELYPPSQPRHQSVVLCEAPRKRRLMRLTHESVHLRRTEKKSMGLLLVEPLTSLRFLLQPLPTLRREVRVTALRAPRPLEYMVGTPSLNLAWPGCSILLLHVTFWVNTLALKQVSSRLQTQFLHPSSEWLGNMHLRFFPALM